MKYIFLSILALVICAAFGYGVAWMINRKKPLTKVGKILFSVLSSVLLIVVAAGVYFGIYYRADDNAKLALTGSPEVTVIKVKGGYFFDGPSEDTAIVFYPGAKVASEAYAPLMLEIAENGADCFLAEMPFRMAIFKTGAAEEFIRGNTRDHWYIAGHSMGGLAAATYAADHPEEIEGVIFLASYTTKKLPENLRVLSVYGSEDKVLDRTAYEDGKAYWTEGAQETVIEGGNHAQFGSYGKQSGDGEALISAKEQLSQTTDAVISFLHK